MFIVRSVVDYFTTHGSNVYVSTLHLSKALVRINNCQLIIKLISVGVPVDVIIMLGYWFQNMYVCVEFCGKMSNTKRAVSDKGVYGHRDLLMYI